MEISTLLGLVLGLIAVFVGMIIKGAPISSIANPAAFLIIIVGTMASVVIAFPMAELKKFPKIMAITFKKQNLVNRTELISMFMEWASVTRREGLLALESKVEEIEDDFLRSGMRMIIDGSDQDFVRDVLMENINATEMRHRAGALMFTQAGTYAPTLGVLGAVIGLIAALSDMSSMEHLTHAIAAAFVATLLGIFTGYVIWHPLANKLKRISEGEIQIRLMMLEGLLSIQSGVSTIAISQKLSVFLTPSERLEMERKEGGGANE